MIKLYFSFINNGEILLFLLKKMLKKIYSKKKQRSDEIINLSCLLSFLWLLKKLLKVNYISQKKANDILFEKKESLNKEINNYLQ